MSSSLPCSSLCLSLLGSNLVCLFTVELLFELDVVRDKLKWKFLLCSYRASLISLVRQCIALDREGSACMAPAFVEEAILGGDLASLRGRFYNDAPFSVLCYRLNC